MACRNYDSQSGFYENYDGTKIHAGIQPVGGGGWLAGEDASCPVTLSLNTWHMVTYAVSDTGYTIYIDGALGTSASWTATPELSPGGCDLQIGGRSQNGPMSNTSIDDFQLYNGTLSADQINALYLTGATSHGALPTTTPVQVAAGAILDLNGVSQQSPRCPTRAAAAGRCRTATPPRRPP